MLVGKSVRSLLSSASIAASRRHLFTLHRASTNPCKTPPRYRPLELLLHAASYDESLDVWTPDGYTFTGGMLVSAFFCFRCA